MALTSEEWDIKDCSDNDKKKTIILICNGPPLDYYMFPLGWAGKVNFTGLLREQDVKHSQGNVMDPFEGHGSSLPFAGREKNLFLHVVAMGSELHPSWSKLETVDVSRWQKGTPYCPSPGTWSCVCVCFDVCVWVEGLTHTRCTSLSWLWEYVCVGQVHQDPSINQVQIRPAPLLTRG